MQIAQHLAVFESWFSALDRVQFRVQQARLLMAPDDRSCYAVIHLEIFCGRIMLIQLRSSMTRWRIIIAGLGQEPDCPGCCSPPPFAGLRKSGVTGGERKDFLASMTGWKLRVSLCMFDE